MLIEETLYLGSDNVIALALRNYQETIAHTVPGLVKDTETTTHTHPAITRCKLSVNAIVGDNLDVAVVIDSNTQPTWFDFTDPLVLVLKLSGSTLKPGRHLVTVTIFEVGNALGVVWGSLMLRVV